jgi:Uma2 family endonuclease
VRVALLVDPADDSVLVFRANLTPEAFHAPAKIDLRDVLPSFTLSVKELFSALTLR